MDEKEKFAVEFMLEGESGVVVVEVCVCRCKLCHSSLFPQNTMCAHMIDEARKKFKRTITEMKRLSM
jgi:hypothetical protein